MPIKNMKYSIRILIWGCLSLGLLRIPNVQAQSIAVGQLSLEDAYRRQQLMGKIDPKVSFTIRPLTNKLLQRNNVFDPDSVLDDQYSTVFPYGEAELRWLPVVLKHQIASGYPYGWGDGPMIPAVGHQTYISGGLHARYKWLSIQLNPEIVTAENRAYMGYNGDNPFAWELWYKMNNNIDMPERFGEGWYTRAYLGQSSIMAHFGGASAGISTENLWWGPGRKNSLLMTNNAPGFLHASVQTDKPIETPIGSFEGQLVLGRLKGSGFTPTPLGNPDHYDQFYKEKNDDWRYFSGAIITYQPKWFEGLSLGMTRSFVSYSKDLKGGPQYYLPFIGPRSEVTDDDPPYLLSRENKMRRDMYSSFFGRWLMPRGNFEVYFEYGRTDPPWNSRDMLVQTDHSRGYVVGFRKLIPLGTLDEDLIQVAFEATQLEAGRSSTIRTSPSWYTDVHVRHGYTHRGQVLGAGIGPGSNVQSVMLGWSRGIKQAGIELERFVHQGDFYYSATTDFRRKWVDLGMNAFVEWDINRWVVQGKFTYMYAYNYQYDLELPNQNWKGFWDFIKKDNKHTNLQLGVMYRF
jgi:hypothetical protein